VNALLKKALKYAAGKAFTWGLKKLTELSPEEIKDAPQKPKPIRRHRKPYVN